MTAPSNGGPHFCTGCGAPLEAGAAFCTGCGRSAHEAGATSPLPPQPAPPAYPQPGWGAAPAGSPPPPGPPPQGSPRDRSAWLLPLLLISGVCVLLVIALVVVIVARDDGSEEATVSSVTPLSSTTTSASSTAPTSAPPTTPTTAGTTRPPQATDVADLPAGLLCRDLAAQGWSYVDAVDYWSLEGYPDRMDADLNGIPCETVYPRSDVTAYWGEVEPPPDVAGLPSGLFCRDLVARGVSYPDAVAYWFAEGAPDRMDEDLNGIPCETVYSAGDVTAYWG